MNPPPKGQRVGIVKALAHRPSDGEPMSVIDACNVAPGRGLDTENRKPGKREITLLSDESWAEACRDLGVDLPWHLRRANILVEGIDFASTVGMEITIGDVRVHVHGETKPCGLMDQQHLGLRNALQPAFRGGVYGQILSAGTIRVGDTVRLTTQSPSDADPR